MRLTATRSSITSGGGAVLDPIIQEDPTLDLNFADSKVLRDDVDSNNPVTFTRTSSATYVGADGLIKTTPVNLLTYSEQFDQWTVASNSVISPDAAVAPDGTNTADGLYFTATGSTNVSQDITLTQGQQYTFSVYAKAVTPGSNNKFKPYINSLTPKSPSVDYEATSEWQRFSFTFTHTNTTGSTPVFILNSGDAYITNVYFWGAQLEEGSTATDYIRTTSTTAGAPRFDHDLATGESLGLLIEEARTNKILLSENLAVSADWIASDGATTSLSNITSPDGVSKMWLVDLSAVAGSSSSGPRVYHNNLTFNNEVHTFSFYARSVSGTGTFPVGFFDGSDYVKSYVTLTENIQRYEISCPAGLPTFGHNIFGFTRRGTTHDETLTQAYVWGCQVEVGSFPTSYIPTSGSTVTRAADLAEISGTNFSSWYNQSEGTVFIKVLGAAYNQFDSYEISNGSVNNRRNIRFDANASKIKRTIVGAGSISQQQSGTTYTGYPVSFKAAATDNFKFFADGVSGSISGNLNALPTNMTQLSIGSRGSQSSDYLNGHISRLAYFPVRLPDATLQNITT